MTQGKPLPNPVVVNECLAFSDMSDTLGGPVRMLNILQLLEITMSMLNRALPWKNCKLDKLPTPT